MKKSSKVLLGMLGAGMVLAVVVTVGYLVAERKDEPAGEMAEEKPRELPDGTLATDEPVVKELYEKYKVEPWQGFYADELLVGSFWGDNRERGRLELALSRAENWTGEAVRAKYRELFGDEIGLTEEKYGKPALEEEAKWLASGMKLAFYDGAKDEFVELEGGTDAGGRYIQRLERAEKAGERIYLYERVLSIGCRPDPRFDEEGNQIGGGSYCAVLMVAATCGTPDIMWTGDQEGMTDEEVLNEAKRKSLGLVRWVFEQNAEGNYVFRGLEQVMEGENGEEIIETIEEREKKIKEENNA